MNPHEELKQLFAHRNGAEVAIEIHGFTGFRTTLIEDLTEKEAISLLSIHRPEEKTAEELEEEFQELSEEILKKGWKSKILKVAEDTGIKDKNDFVKFNRWMLTSSKFKKHLNAHTLDELKLLHAQLHGVKHNNSKSAKKPLTKAWWFNGAKLKNLN